MTNRRLWLKIAAIGLIVGTAGGACGDSEPVPAAGCRPSTATPTGTVADDNLTEISGVVASRTTPGLFWVHQDSGDAARVYALDATGRTRATFDVVDAAARDWEDIAMGPGPEAHGEYLYLGDIGDNTASRSRVTVYRVAEPSVEDSGGTTLDGVETLHLAYPDGARDAETLIVDPSTGDLVIITKSIAGRAEIYVAPARPGPGITTMEALATLQLGLGSAVTGGDIAAGRDRLAIRTYGDILVWRIGPGESLAEALAREPCSVPVGDEEQGEAVGFGPDLGLVTISEGSAPLVNQYEDPFREG